MDSERTTRLARRAGRVARMLTTIVLATTLAVPVVARASHQFDDVATSHTFHADIDWLADKDVTKGCNPPGNTRYCPDDFVTREQMAAFMHRLETQGVFLPKAGKAADADTLDGLDSTSYARIEEVIELGDLHAEFLPIATISVVNGNTATTANSTSHRRPVSAPPTFTRVVDGKYMIDFPGIGVTFTDYIATCTAISGPVYVTYGTTGGDLRVELRDSSGALATGNYDDFACVLYNA